MGGLYVGIDIGTSSVRAVAFDLRGEARGLSQRSYAMESPQPGWAELDPGLVWESSLAVVEDCLAQLSEAPVAMALSCQMHSLLAVDRHGEALGPAWLWADTRAQGQADALAQSHDVQELYRRTGCRVEHPMYPLSKLRWHRELFPEAQVARYITLKEYVIHAMTGEYLVDVSLAASQGLVELRAGRWDRQVVEEVAGIALEQLSPIAPCEAFLPALRGEVARRWGVPRELPICVGTGDGLAANLGCGVFGPELMASTLGTSGALRTTVASPLLDPLRRSWCYPLSSQQYVAGGAINNGGLVLAWLRRLTPDTPEAQWTPDAWASEVEPGCGGLVFLPFLTGERSPDWNAQAPGCLWGLRPSHGMPALVRAAMEGICYRLRWVWEGLLEALPRPRLVVASGGYVRSPVWLQMQADVLGCTVVRPGVEEASALGAAYLAMVATGAVAMGQTLPAMEARQRYHPRPQLQALYDAGYHRAQKLYHHLVAMGTLP